MVPSIYRLVFYGEINQEHDIESTKQKLQGLFKTDRNKVEELFKSSRKVIKSNLDLQACLKFKAVFEKTGAICAVEVQEFALTSEGPAPPQETLVNADEQKSFSQNINSIKEHAGKLNNKIKSLDKSKIGNFGDSVAQKFKPLELLGKTKIIAVAAMLIILLGAASLFLGSSPSSSTVEQGIVRLFATQFNAPDNAIILDSIKITNSFTKEMDNEEFFVYEFQANLKVQDWNYSTGVVNGKIHEHGLQYGTFALVKRGSEWYNVQ